MNIELTKNPKVKPDFGHLGFGKYFTDHMLVMDYDNGVWGEPKIIPFESFHLSPATSVLHYAQGIFEGLKAYKSIEGSITMFRPDENIKRMNKSSKRLCMPIIDEAVVLPALKELIKIEESWIPTSDGTALYIRPTMIGTDVMLGVHASHSYKFFIILSPVGAYYSNGLQPTKIYIEDFYVRAAIGGTGEVKCMGNYAASLIAGEEASKKGYDQVLWLDAAEKKYVEEVGSMNIFFVFDGVVVTPMLNGSILPGITRKSAIQVLKDNGYKVEERRISVQEVEEAYSNGKLDEAFGTGTAAVVSPVGLITYKGNDMHINGGKMGDVTTFLYNTITKIQTSKIADPYGWVVKVK